jgi:hypothetical protein
MKKFALILAALCVVVSLHAQEENKSYRMYDFVYIKPDYQHIEDLSKAMAKHNREYHNEGPYRARIWAVQTGEYTGWWAWIMGPCTYTDLDGRPDSKEHNEDWMGEVIPYVEELRHANFWKLNEDQSYIREGDFTGREIWTVFDLRPFEKYRFNELLSQVKKVYEEKDYQHSYEVFHAEMEMKEMGEVIIVSSFPNWAFFDRDRNFKKDFNEVHGEGAYWKFMEEYRDIVVSVDDQVTEVVPELSGGMKENK